MRATKKKEKNKKRRDKKKQKGLKKKKEGSKKTVCVCSGRLDDEVGIGDVFWRGGKKHDGDERGLICNVARRKKQTFTLSQS